MERFIPLSVPNFEGNEKKYVMEAIESTWVSTGGGYIKKLEGQLAGFLNTADVAACQSGTAALHLSLVDAGVGPGDVVLVPPLTFIAAVNPVKYQFATPVFIDCDDSLCMDPEKLKCFCEKECSCKGGGLTYRGRPVKAVIVVHVFGNMADMEGIMETAGRYGLKVIEDATEALGSCCLTGAYRGKYAGTIGDYGAFSFNGNKIITTGGGGAATAKEGKDVAHIRYLSTQAKDDGEFYIHHEVGYNYRMTNLQAALGVAQMEELPEFIRRKQENYERYREIFDGFALARLMGFRDGTAPNKWFYSLLIDRGKVRASMGEVIGALKDEGVQARAVWGLIHEQRPYGGEDTYMLEKAPYYFPRVLNIPCSTQLTEDDIAYVGTCIKRVLEGLADGT
ncbi:aminotransferase DegT [Clostridiaceae bacterium]|nr:aminotransferase DegT [Clostridiaceae bacterium]RKI08577.1 aminotransferase DegT [bacterium 1XD21-70]